MKVNCDSCGHMFNKKTYEVKRTKGNFCSTECKEGLYIGKTFNDLTCISEADRPTKKTKMRFFLFKCKCGNERIACGSVVKRGEIKSCKECSATGMQKDNNSLWKGHGEISGVFWRLVVRHAADRNILMAISIEQAWNLFVKQDRKCALSGLELSFSKTNRLAKLTTASLDRIDSTKGYTIDNIQWVHKDINVMKWNFNQNRFLKLCALISKYQASLAS